MRIIALFVLCYSAMGAESISATIDKNTLTVTATVDATALKAEYAAKKAATGKTDAELKTYRDVLILDAIKAAIERARIAAEQTDAERAAELSAAKARLDQEYAKRASLKPAITVNP